MQVVLTVQEGIPGLKKSMHWLSKRYKINGRGITFQDLISSGLVKHKSQAQNTLKRCLARKILFAPDNHKPQQYFPTSLMAEIDRARLSKNALIRVTRSNLLTKYISANQGCHCNANSRRICSPSSTSCTSERTQIAFNDKNCIRMLS